MEIEEGSGTSNDALIRISDTIPPQFRSIFKYENFNAMQSILLPQIMQSDVSGYRCLY